MARNHFPMLSRFNRWANGLIYDAAAKLPDAERKRDRKAFFGSLHNTLDHILLVDRVYTARIEGRAHGITRLNELLYGDFDALRNARQAEDERLIGLVDRLGEDRLPTVVSYKFLNGQPAKTPVELIFLTLFNHQTHHRGQVHNMLSQAGIDPPELDIINFPGAAT
ncbi:MAG: DinB family protein [Alphaproteobacteria bacterium]